MNAKKMIQILIVGIISVFFISFGWGSSHARTFVLESTPEHPDANGTAVIDTSHVSIQARGLKPDAVYTVWFVNMKPKKKVMGAGVMPYMFRSDKWGDGNYSTSISKAPFGDWAMLMVVLHPNGDPGDMDNMVGALKTPL
jgi:hypothetical protein